MVNDVECLSICFLAIRISVETLSFGESALYFQKKSGKLHGHELIFLAQPGPLERPPLALKQRVLPAGSLSCLLTFVAKICVLSSSFCPIL